MIKIALANRRYYWLQLKEDFFKTKEMKLMRKLPGGEEITIIYLKMMLVSLADEGKIYFEGLADDLAEELALLIDEDPEAIRMALLFLSQKNLLTTSDNFQYKLEQVPELIGSETASTRRSRKHRESQKALQCTIDATKCNGVLKYVGLDGMSFELLNHAIEITSEIHRPSFKYLKAILENWRKEGFTSLEQVEEHEQKRQSYKNTTPKSRVEGNSVIQMYDDPLPF